MFTPKWIWNAAKQAKEKYKCFQGKIYYCQAKKLFWTSQLHIFFFFHLKTKKDWTQHTQTLKLVAKVYCDVLILRYWYYITILTSPSVCGGVHARAYCLSHFIHMNEANDCTTTLQYFFYERKKFLCVCWLNLVPRILARFSFQGDQEIASAELHQDLTSFLPLYNVLYAKHLQSVRI